MRTLRIEMNRGHGWELRATGKIPADVTVEQIQRDLREYAIQYPHRALIDGKEVARTGELPASTLAAGGINAARRSGRLAPRPTGRDFRYHAGRRCGSCSCRPQRVQPFRRLR